MTTPKRILYINHASVLRGASMSLLYTIQSLEAKKYRACVAVAAPEGEVTEFYRSNDIETIAAPDLHQLHFSTGAMRRCFQPCTWVELWRFCFKRKNNDRAMDKLISQMKPDIVHLNSMALSPAANYCKKKNIPFVWHVREPPQTTRRFSLRRRIIGAWLRELPSASIFLSDYDRYSWTYSKIGHVIPNFVDFTAFNKNINGNRIRRELNISDESPVLVFMGGLRAIKGIFTLIRALSIVRHEYPDLRCVMPGSDYSPPDSFSLRFVRVFSRIIRKWPTGHCALTLIHELDLEEVCIRLPYRTDVPEIIACADIMLFPSIRPHFARPVIEASAMAKPVVGSDLPGVCELVIHQETGILVHPSDHQILADSICQLLSDKKKAYAMGQNGYKVARMRYSRYHACRKIMALYDAILSDNT